MTSGNHNALYVCQYWRLILSLVRNLFSIVSSSLKWSERKKKEGRLGWVTRCHKLVTVHIFFAPGKVPWVPEAVFYLRPNTCRPSANKTKLPVAREEKTLLPRESGKFFFFCLWIPDSWALNSGIQLKKSGIPLTIRIQRLSFTDKESTWIQYLQSGIHLK